ncbi:MAG: hypothetical protein WBV80_12300 [Mycobacterium sp.]
MKLTLNVLENRGRATDRHWPSYMFGGRLRTSTLVLIVAFFAVWWTYDTYRPVPTPPAAPQVVPPGFVPDPAYTWVPRSRVQPPPSYDTPTPTTTPPTTPPPTTTTPPTTTPPPLFQLPVLPPPFGPGTTAPAPPGPTPAPAPGPALPGLPGLPG